MRVLSNSEIYESFSMIAKLGKDTVQCEERGLFFIHPEANCIDLDYPTKLERLPFFARLLAALGYDDADFADAFLWLTDWGVWNSREESIGYRTIEAMNRAAGQALSFEAAAGHHFRADELTDAIAMLMQPMIFSWDAYYLPRWSFGHEEFFLHVSHDSFVTVVTRTKEFHDKVFRILQEVDLQPRQGHDLQRKRFCRVTSLP